MWLLIFESEIIYTVVVLLYINSQNYLYAWFDYLLLRNKEMRNYFHHDTNLSLYFWHLMSIRKIYHQIKS
jgi:hypothetical protein